MQCIYFEYTLLLVRCELGNLLYTLNNKSAIVGELYKCNIDSYWIIYRGICS